MCLKTATIGIADFAAPPMKKEKQNWLREEEGDCAGVDTSKRKLITREKTDKDTRWSLEEVQGHNRADSCWLIAHGKVYDATAFLDMHPGGPCIVKRAGKDATRDFEFHSSRGKKLWNKFRIGKLDTEPTCILEQFCVLLFGKAAFGKAASPAISGPDMSLKV
jgi:cytochrome b involved in lipid metabolism